ncbi:MAG: 4Fe-4S binding protein [candidate division WOR-3 bacterium]|nr:4Fe-4S binding protein [candidate division WOR-3 bacterium]
MRRIIQLLSLVLSNSFFAALWKRTIYQGSMKSVCVPILNCYACPLARTSCPIGILQHFIITKSFPFYVIGVFGTVGIFLGRWTCGWLCPFGFLQDLLHKIKSKKLRMKRQITISKYIVLVVLVIVIPFVTLESWFCKLCPQRTLEGGIPIALGFLGGELKSQILSSPLFYLKAGILVAVILLSVFIKRFFCRTICPLGAILGLFNRISLLRLRVDELRCDRCERCREICPVDINIYEDPNSPECVRCMECRKVCNRDAIKLGWK